MAFWYGIGFEEVGRTPIAAIRAYLSNLPALQAEVKIMLANAAIAASPYIKDSDRRDIFSRWEKEAVGVIRRPTAPPPAVLALMGIGVYDPNA